MNLIEEKWIEIPEVVSVGGRIQFKWMGIEVRKCPKGYGVFATIDHPEGLMLPYGGYEIWFGQYRKLLGEGGKSSVSHGKWPSQQAQLAVYVAGRPSIIV